MSTADVNTEIEHGSGGAHTKRGRGADPGAEIARHTGPSANTLLVLTNMWEDVQKARIAADQRGLSGESPDLRVDVVTPLKKMEESLGRAIKKEVGKHVMGDWLPKGLGGVHVARLLAIINDPWRFPGRRCTNGHYMSTAAAPTEIDQEIGGACPVETWEGPCDGTLLPPRLGTGVRSIWHYCGLHVVEGRSPRRQKGKVADWNPDARTIVLMPGGIAEQIVRLRVEKYRDVYDAKKASLLETRADPGGESEPDDGAQDGTEAEVVPASDLKGGLRPVQIDAIARKVAAKAFVGDLLIEWKRRTAA